MSNKYTAPKGITQHPGVLECLSGEAGGSDYKHDVFLREGWRFTQGRTAGCRSLLCHTIAEFKRAAPQPVPAKGADLIGEFITIPAWKITGCVINARPATLGSDDAIEVLVQSKPEDPTPRWYRLEPTEYTIES